MKEGVMAKHTLVAVGGSGQSAAIAFLRLATLSGMPPEELPNIYVIDADVKDRQGADAKPSLYSSLKVLFTQLVQGVPETNKPRLELIFPYSHQQSHEVMSHSTIFADYIINKGGAKQDMGYVVDALFSKKLSHRQSDHILSEQDVPLSKGFMARPNVGATTFFDKLHQNKQNLEPAISRLQDAVAHSQNQAVTVVIGSSFGGTGSGVAPALAQQLAEWAQQSGQKTRIGLFMTLPWFNPNGQKSQLDAIPTHGSTEIQRKNTAGGLRYYASSEAFRNFDVFISDYAGHIQLRNDDSNSEQPEYEHVFNILLASQIQNYFINKVNDARFIDQSAAYTFYCPQLTGQKASFDAGDSALLSFAMNKNLKQDLKNWAHEAQSLRLVLKYTARFIHNHFKLTTSSERDVPSEFATLALEVAKKDGRPSMIMGKSKWNPFGKDRAAHDIYVELAQKLEAREKQLGATIIWLKALSYNCPELRIDDASIQDNPDALFSTYSALKRDRNLEVASIRLFEDALNRKDQNYLSIFENKIANGQHALDAVALIVEEAIRQEIRKDSAAPRQHDEEVSHSENSSVLNTIFIPMQVGNNGQMVNRYLQQINLSTLIDDGKNRQGEVVTIQDNNHPATLSHLSHFSIPSPWGAALLEQWTQKEAIKAAKQNDTKLLIQSAERLEAILWGIFTKKLLVKTIKAEQTGSIAHTAIRVREIETGTRGHETISVAINPVNGQLVAANYPTVGWFATPSIVGTLSEWWDEDNELSLSLPTESVKKAQPNTYEAKLIKSFSQWLKQMLDLHGEVSGGRSATWYDVLYYTYESLIHNISPDTQNVALPEGSTSFLLQLPNRQIAEMPLLQVVDSVNEIIEKACVSQLIVLESETSDGQFIHKCPTSPLKSTTKGKARRLNTSGVMNERGGQGRYLNLTYELDLAEGKFTVIRKAKIVFLRVQQVIWPNFKVQDWKLYFAGATATDNQALINQVSPDYAYQLYSDLPNGEKKQVQYITSHSEELQEFKTPLFFDRNYEIFGVPDVLVLLEKVVGTETYQEVGIIDTHLVELDQNQKLQFKLGLDFGTSHSCVVALDKSNKKIEGVDFSRPQLDNDLLLKVIETQDGDEHLFDEFRFLAPKSARIADKELDRNVLPTEFRFNKWLSPASPLKEIDAGIRYLTILPMQFNTDFAERSIKETGALGDFKWGAPAKSSSLTSTLYESEEPLLSIQYIKQILRMSLAILRSKGYSNLTTFRATYPEAFTTAHTNIFAKDLENIWTKIFQETGMSNDKAIDNASLLRFKDFIQGTDPTNGQDLTALSHGLVSESVSALQTTLKTSERNQLSDKRLQIVLDMGGGSTDVAVFLNQHGLDTEKLKNVPSSLTDSIRYAGHDILNLLSTAEIAKVLDDNVKLDGTQNIQQYMRVIKMAMRDSKAVHRLQTRFVEPSFASTVKSNVREFFEGLFEYTRQLIVSYQELLNEYEIDDFSVGIVLLGNGWRLGNLVYPTQNLTSVDGLKYSMEEYLKKHTSNVESLNIVFPSSSDISVKESIAYGSLLYNAEEEFLTHSGESALSRKRYSFLGNTEFASATSSKFLTQKKLEDRRNQSAPQIEVLPIFPENSSFINRLNGVKGQEGKGLHFAKIDMNKQLQIHWASAEDEILISPMQLFLENIWKPTLLNDK